MALHPEYCDKILCCPTPTHLKEEAFSARHLYCVCRSVWVVAVTVQALWCSLSSGTQYLGTATLPVSLDHFAHLTLTHLLTPALKGVCQELF